MNIKSNKTVLLLIVLILTAASHSKGLVDDIVNVVSDMEKEFSPVMTAADKQELEKYVRDYGNDLPLNSPALSEKGKSLDLNSNGTSCNIVARQAVIVSKAGGQNNLDQVVNTFTEYVQSPKGKNAQAQTQAGIINVNVKVKWDYWEMSNGSCSKITDDSPEKPMVAGQSYTVRKCMSANLSSDIVCNTYTYHLKKIDDNTSVLYSVQSSDETNTQLNKLCGISAEQQKQQQNVFKTASSETVFRKTGDSVDVYDLNRGSSDNKDTCDNLKKRFDVMTAVMNQDHTEFTDRLGGQSLHVANYSTNSTNIAAATSDSRSPASINH